MRNVFARLSYFLSCALFGTLLSAQAAAAAPNTASASAAPTVTIHLDQIFQLDIPGVCGVISKDQLPMVDLRINGVLSGMHPVDCDPDPAMNKLSFVVPPVQTSGENAQREMLFGSPWRVLKSDFYRDLPYTVSFNNGTGVSVLGTGTLRIQILKTSYIVIGFVLILAVGIALVRLGAKSGLLRDTNSVASNVRTYSLARVQMAWWFFIVFASYVWLWVVAEGMPELSAQALGLMGVGSGTYLAAAGVDAGKQNQFGESEGFWLDILSDAQGLALYRFQMLAFNILFGVLFLVYVVQHVSMPQFDGNILTLLGMSAGTYAGFKIPEKQNKSTPDSDDQKQGYTAAT